MTARPTSVAPVAAGALLVLMLWQFASLTAGDYWVPTVQSVAWRVWTEAAQGRLGADLLATVVLLVAGTLIGGLCGVALACALRFMPRVDRMLQPFLTAMMSVPKLGLVPLLVLWFGTGATPKICLVALTVAFIVFSIVYGGLVTVDERLVQVARLMGASPAQVATTIVLPSVLPFVLTGLEVALPWSLSAVIVAEYLSGGSGVGHIIEQARQLRDSVGVFYGILASTFIVLAGNGCLALLRRALTRGPGTDVH